MLFLKALSYRLLIGNVGVDVKAVIVLEVGVDKGERLVEVLRAVEEYSRVRWVIVSCVRGAELIVGQLGNYRGVSARVLTVAGVGIEHRGDVFHFQLVNRRIRTLHFIENYALIGQGLVF